MAAQPPAPPAWAIVPTPDGHYRWAPFVVPAGSRPVHSPFAPNPSASRLPSTADLLVQAERELLGSSGRTERGEGTPVLRTGSGRPAVVLESSASIRRKRPGGVSMLGVVSEEDEQEMGGGGPMFTTGAGRSVRVKMSSLARAASILSDGDPGNAAGPSGLGVGGEMEVGGGVAMFRTGSGRSVSVGRRSIEKAATLLGGGGGEGDGGSRKATDFGCVFSGSHFKTGSGKTVGLSSTGLRNAAALLGLEDKCNFSSECGDGYLTKPVLPVTEGDNNEPIDCKFQGFPPHGHPVDKVLGSFNLELFQPSNIQSSASLFPPMQFQSASGRSLLVSHDSLQRARCLLGDSGSVSMEAGNDREVSAAMMKTDNGTLNKENACTMNTMKFGFKHLNEPKMGLLLDKDLSTYSLTTMNMHDFRKATVEESNPSFKGICLSECKTSCTTEKSRQDHHYTIDKTVVNPTGDRPTIKPLGEITNIVEDNTFCQKHFIRGNNRLELRSFTSPFKKPRNSRFRTPLKKSSSDNHTTDCCILKNYVQKPKLSTYYPPKFKRKSLMDFFGGPPCYHAVNLPSEIKWMTPEKAEKYQFKIGGDYESIGVDGVMQLLLQSGASSSNLTKEWVANHYKWIVWKLACLERSSSLEGKRNYLTVSNVLEELKYRYEREMNLGQRSAVKKILDGDASPASMIVLCISAVLSCYSPRMCKIEHKSMTSESINNNIQSEGAEDGPSKIELTDGWYSLSAILDAALSRHLLCGKLFVGQKLRICGAGICGWGGPVSPLDTPKTIHLLLHVNGTYRTHWADKLGFCRGAILPLSLNCVKGDGGPVPKILVGVTRVYPLLYKEKFSNGRSVVRSKNMEMKVIQLHCQRRAHVIDDIMSEEREHFVNDNDSEGAKIFKILHSSAEPEVLMADMTSEQLSSFTEYQSKQEKIRQSYLEKKIEKALEKAGLQKREVTTFMRVRVTGLTSKQSSRKHHRKEGLITIWCPTERHSVELVEGQIYSVSGLVPQAMTSGMIYLQAKGSNTIWSPFPWKDKFESFFSARKPVLLSNLGEVALASEYDIAAVVVYVGDVYFTGLQKRQWLFVTDSSINLRNGELDVHSHLLAINFCSSIVEDDLTPLINHNLSGCIVGFYNIVKKPRDQANHLWVSEATENSFYSLYQRMPKSCHLREAADAAHCWAKTSSTAIQMLRDRVMVILGGSRV